MIAVEVEADAAAAAERAAGLIAERIDAAVAARGRAAIALSGGSTPRLMLERLGRLDLPWTVMHVFQVDERLVPRDSAERNLNTLLHALSPSSEHADRIHAMPVEQIDAAAAARAYAATLESVLGPEPRLDVAHLGLGADGHTASLFPEDPALASAADVAVTGAHDGLRRMTLTASALDRARWRLWLVTGSAKRAVLERFAAGDTALVATRLRPSDSVVIADRAAAGSLRHSPARQP